MSSITVAGPDETGLRPDRCPMHAELLRQRGDADAVCAGCSHSVHFLVREPCSRSFLWFRRRADQRVIGPAVGLCIGADALIPRGNKPLNPWSPVPAALHCVHHRALTRTYDFVIKRFWKWTKRNITRGVNFLLSSLNSVAMIGMPPSPMIPNSGALLSSIVLSPSCSWSSGRRRCLRVCRGMVSRAALSFGSTLISSYCSGRRLRSGSSG